MSNILDKKKQNKKREPLIRDFAVCVVRAAIGRGFMLLPFYRERTENVTLYRLHKIRIVHTCSCTYARVCSVISRNKKAFIAPERRVTRQVHILCVCMCGCMFVCACDMVIMNPESSLVPAVFVDKHVSICWCGECVFLVCVPIILRCKWNKYKLSERVSRNSKNFICKPYIHHMKNSNPSRNLPSECSYVHKYLPHIFSYFRLNRI